MKNIVIIAFLILLSITIFACSKKNIYEPTDYTDTVVYSTDMTEVSPITEIDIYGDWILIKTPGELIYLDKNQGIIGTKNIRIVNNLDLAGTQILGITTFAKIFDGNNKIIANFKINKPSSDYAGIINILNAGGTVSNIVLKNSQIIGANYVGGVIGQNYGMVENCQNMSASITGIKGVGGIVGRNEDGGSIKNCINTATVLGDNNVGGIAGKNYANTTPYSSIIENCYNTGSITATRTSASTDVGGIVGDNEGSIKSCYNTGLIHGDDVAGGVLGNNFNGIIENCYNTGAVSSSYNGSEIGCIGGVVGNNNVTVKNCYNTGTVSFTGTAADISSAGVVGDNAGTIENCYNIGIVYGLNYVGGVVGYVEGSGTQSECYFLKTTGINETLSGIGDDGSGATSDINATPITSLGGFSSIAWGSVSPWKIKNTLALPVNARPVLIGVGPEGQ